MTHTIEQGIAHEAPSTGTDPQQPPRRSRRPVLGWAAVATGLVAAVVLLLLTITSDPSSQRITAPTPTEDSVVGRPVGVPRSADGAERYLADHQSSRPMGVPGSADGAERYLADHQSSLPTGVPGSADGAERYLANQQGSRPTGVPGSADGAERYLADHR
jgi:hypothetical protein